VSSGRQKLGGRAGCTLAIKMEIWPRHHWKSKFLQGKEKHKKTCLVICSNFSLKARIFLKVNVGYRKAAVPFVFCNQNQKSGPEKHFENQQLWSVNQKKENYCNS